jgi:hypothetical protein
MVVIGAESYYPLLPCLEKIIITLKTIGLMYEKTYEVAT